MGPSLVNTQYHNLQHHTCPQIETEITQSHIKLPSLSPPIQVTLVCIRTFTNEIHKLPWIIYLENIQIFYLVVPVFLLLFSCSSVARLNPFVLWSQMSLLHQLLTVNEYEAMVGWKLEVWVPLCPLQIPCGPTWDWIWATALRNQRLTTWTMEWWQWCWWRQLVEMHMYVLRSDCWLKWMFSETELVDILFT
jgi:hypothetical protein